MAKMARSLRVREIRKEECRFWLDGKGFRASALTAGSGVLPIPGYFAGSDCITTVAADPL